MIAGIVLLVTGHNPLTTYRQLFDAAFPDPGSLRQTLITTTPLIFTGLAAAAAFRMRLFNIGAEGQLYLGAIFGAAAGLYLGDDGPTSSFVIAAMVRRRRAGGALWALIPGVLRAFFRTNEIITSLMLNYVAGYLLTYLIFESESYWRDTNGFNATVFPAEAAADLGDLAGVDDPRPGRRRRPARAPDRHRRRRRPLVALPAHALRVRGPGAERLGARRPLRRRADPAEDPRGDGDLGRDRGHRRRAPGRRLRPRPRRRPERPAEARLRLHGHRRRSTRALQPASPPA